MLGERIINLLFDTLWQQKFQFIPEELLQFRQNIILMKSAKNEPADFVEKIQNGFR